MNKNSDKKNKKHYIAWIPFCILLFIQMFPLGLFWMFGVYIFYSIKEILKIEKQDKKLFNDLTIEKNKLKDLLYKTQQMNLDLVAEFDNLEKQFYIDNDINYDMFNEYINIQNEQVLKIEQAINSFKSKQKNFQTKLYEKKYYKLKENAKLFINILQDEKKEIQRNKIECNNKIIEIGNKIRNFRENFVKQNSESYKLLIKLNENLKFPKNEYYKQYEVDCNSKSQFNNFNFEKYLISIIDNEKAYFYNLENNYRENEEKYKKYLKDYEEIEKTMSNEKDYEFSEISFALFNMTEKEFYNTLFQQKNDPPKVVIDIRYASPTGRNFYKASKEYEFSEITDILKIKKLEEKQKLLEIEEKEKKLEEKRAKEKRLRDLDKLEKKLCQREDEINKKEEEFLKATQGHIYATVKISNKEQVIETNQNLSLSQKLKLLKENFDNGEITYEEYQIKRKDLI